MTTPAIPKRMHRGGPFGIGRDVVREDGHFTWVYLWSAPLRAMHWLAAASIVVLVVTGFYIGRPYFMTSGEASAHFAMGRIRFVHFAAAAVFVMTGIVRVYWLMAGTQFERLPALFPLTATNLKNLVRTGISYATFRSDTQPRFVGHNPLAQVGYTVTYLLAMLMVVTGFALYGQSNPGGMIFQLFGWVSPLVGGLQHVRLIHHATTWAFVLFVIFHVYFALRADYVERVGIISSIITGARVVATDETYEDFDVNTAASTRWPTGEHNAFER